MRSWTKPVPNDGKRETLASSQNQGVWSQLNVESARLQAQQDELIVADETGERQKTPSADLCN